MALTATPATLSFTSPLAPAQIVTITGGGVFPYSASSVDITKATVGSITSIPGNGTWNPSDKNAAITLSNGNLTASVAGGGAFTGLRALIGVFSGKPYWEIVYSGTTGSSVVGVGTSAAALNGYVGSDANAWGYDIGSGQSVHNGSFASYGAAAAVGDVIGIAWDATDGTLTFFKNGVSQGVAFTGLSGTLFPMASFYAVAASCTANFGATGTFAYTPPAGYSAYSSLNSGTFVVSPAGGGTTTINVTDSTSPTPLQVSIPATIIVPSITFLAANNAGDAGDPLPAGVFTSIATSGGTVVASGYLGVGGSMPAILTPGVQYTAMFTGTRAPSVSATFTAVDQSQSVTVSPYASPAHSQPGYATDLASMYPRGWAGNAALEVGGGIYTIKYGAAAEFVDLNNQNQGVILSARLQSAINDDIDLWIEDYCGQTFPRFSGESNAAYIARFQSFASAKLGTPSGVEVVGGFYGSVIIDEPWRACETGAFDTNGTLAFDTVGGFGSQKPGTDVFLQPAVPFTQAQGAQAKAAILAARGLGIPASVFQVTQSGMTLTATQL